jgi:choline dehydrogenase
METQPKQEELVGQYNGSSAFALGSGAVDFPERVRLNQQTLGTELKPSYDFIVCGSGSSGSVVARRLAENPTVSVLLLEAGGGDDVPSVMNAGQWPLNLETERQWNFRAQPNARLNGRAMPLNMGRVLGGGSSVNAMIWARGHMNDWDFFAAEAGDRAWNYDSVLDIYRRIEDWRGVPDPKRRGAGGLLFVQPAPDPNPIAPAMVVGAASLGIKAFDDAMGPMMETDGGAALNNLRVRGGQRLSVFRSYVYPAMDRPNLTVLCSALVLRVLFENRRAVGVEVSYRGAVRRIRASCETILSMGAINTPTLLMQSGIGDAAELKRFGIPIVQHLPGVGKNFQDHVLVSSIWEYVDPLAPRNNGGEATAFWKSDSSLNTPDIHVLQAEFPLFTPENADYEPPPGAWSICACLVRPRSRGEIRLTGSNPRDAVQICANTLDDPADLKALVRAVEFCREIGNSEALRPFAKREVMPGPLKGLELENFIRNAIATVWHQTCTAKMGRDAMSVVDHQLKVHEIENLRIADGSIMPRVTTGNTMAPCIVIGERAAGVLRARHKLSPSEAVSMARA